jgi:hypothetical protein
MMNTYSNDAKTNLLSVWALGAFNTIRRKSHYQGIILVLTYIVVSE